MNYIQEIWSLVFQSVSSLPAEFWIYCRWAISLKLILKCDELQSSHQVDIKTRSLQDQPDEESLLFCVLLFSLLSSSIICLRNASYLSKRQKHHCDLMRKNWRLAELYQMLFTWLKWTMLWHMKCKWEILLRITSMTADFANVAIMIRNEGGHRLVMVEDQWLLLGPLHRSGRLEVVGTLP